MPSGLTRRTFLNRVGQTGGAVALHGVMRALELASPAAAEAFSPIGTAPAGRSGAASRVIVIGAGLAGLTTAYELRKLGYTVEVLEARGRTGGRCFTVRGGTVSEEDGPKQTCKFDPDLYINAGPARIPHHHAITLAYCKELGVPLEVFTSVNEAAYVHQSAPKDAACTKLRLKEIRADWRGYTSELLAKAVTRDALDRQLTKEDRDRIVDWLKREGQLDAELRYAGTNRRGWRVAQGAGNNAGTTSDPLGFEQLLLTDAGTTLPIELMLQMPMFQPVGGMDRIAKALTERVPNVTLGVDVQAIEQPAGRVRVKYRDAKGADKVMDGAFCVCALPLPVLREMNVDVVPELKAAIGAINYAKTGKIGIQFKRRFWEEDDGIYGGITKTDQPITQILYPSYGYQSRKGVVVGYYHNGDPAGAMGELTPDARLARAMEQGAKIHPQYPTEFENAFSIAWHRVPYNRGGWAQYSEAQRRHEYQRLLEPDRGVYLAGDHLTYLGGWMAGAFESARRVVSAIHERASREAGTALTASSPHQQPQ
jgi:monoamine oxidase